MDARLEGFADARLDVNLDYLPSFPFAFNKRTLLRDGFVTVHVEVDLFRRWIAVIPEHYLLGGFHGPQLCQLDADSNSCGAFETGTLSGFSLTFANKTTTTKNKKNKQKKQKRERRERPSLCEALYVAQNHRRL
jgi:hypothetical protein